MPDGLAALAGAAEREGIRVVRTLIERWVDGTERYDRPGEAVLAAMCGGEVVGVGALSECPHVRGALRVRRFYVATGWRRCGVARALATHLIESASERVGTITCNAQASAAAAPFWEAMRFVPVHTEGVTHIRRV